MVDVIPAQFVTKTCICTMYIVHAFSMSGKPRMDNKGTMSSLKLYDVPLLCIVCMPSLCKVGSNKEVEC